MKREIYNTLLLIIGTSTTINKIIILKSFDQLIQL